MPAPRRVSLRQMELLAEFAENHSEIALGKFPGGPRAIQTIREVWSSVTDHLNSVADGTTKTSDQWRRYWIEFKAKTKAKAADTRRNASATGGGPNKLAPLTEIEKRVLAIIGTVAVEGLPGVRLSNIPSVDETEAPSVSGIVPPDPESHLSTSTHYPTILESSPAPISPFSEPIMDVEWLEEDIPSPLELQPEVQLFVPQPSAVTHPADASADSRPQSNEPPRVSSRAESHAQRSSPPSRMSRSQRPTRKNERVPRWAYEIEMRRIAAEERHATAMEALVNLMTDIRDDARSYMQNILERK